MKKKYGYVDGFIVPVPKKKLAAYKKMAQLGAKIWKDHGAIDYTECIAHDAKPGKVTSFPQSVKLKKGEVVVFSWITYKSKADRDRALKKVFNDPRMEQFMDEGKMPFDGMRMIFGGFKPFVIR